MYMLGGTWTGYMQFNESRFIIIIIQAAAFIQMKCI